MVFAIYNKSICLHCDNVFPSFYVIFFEMKKITNNIVCFRKDRKKNKSPNKNKTHDRHLNTKITSIKLFKNKKCVHNNKLI